MSSELPVSAFAPYFSLRSEGAAPSLRDIWLGTVRMEPDYETTDMPIPAHSERIGALPDMGSAGRLYDLRDAMALDDAGLLEPPFYGDDRGEPRTLSQLVAAFGQEEDAEARHELIERILLRWAGAEDVTPSDYADWSPDSLANIDPRQIAVAEAIRGSKWSDDEANRNPNANAAAELKSLYDLAYDGVWASLMAQTHLSSLYAGVDSSVDSDSGRTSLDFSGVDFPGADSTAASRQQFRDFIKSLLYFVSERDLLTEVRDSAPDIAGQFAGYVASLGGNDRLVSGAGSDVYWLARGMGYDTITEAGGDVIRLEEGLTSQNVRLGRDNDNLLVQLLDESGTVTDIYIVENHYTDASRRISRVELSDGSRLFDEDEFETAIFRHDPRYSGTLRGADERVDHFDSDGQRNDFLYGGVGADVFWLGYGTGQDTIRDAGEGDVIRLKEGLTAQSVEMWYSSYGSDSSVVVSLNELADGGIAYQLTDIYVVDFNDGEERVIPRIELFNGTLVYSGGIFDPTRIIRGGEGDDHLVGFDLDSYGTEHFDADAGGHDSLHGGWGSDVYWLGNSETSRGTGHDKIYEDEWYYPYYPYHPDSPLIHNVIRLEEGLGFDDVRLDRDTNHLYVRLVDEAGMETDSYTVMDYYLNPKTIERVELSNGTVLIDPNHDPYRFDTASFNTRRFDQAGIRGDEGDNELHGLDGRADHFDADAGGDDTLYGGTGADVYWLGLGTGNDTIREVGGVFDRDVIRLEKGLNARLSRSEHDLHVLLLDENGELTGDSYTVDNYYTDEAGRIIRVEQYTRTLFDVVDFDDAIFRGGEGVDELRGTDGADQFDVEDGDGILHGGTGADIYWLGYGTGHDTIREVGGVADGDVIRIKEGVEDSNVRVRRDADNLYVQVLKDDKVTDSYTVLNHYNTSGEQEISRVLLSSGETLYTAGDEVQDKIPVNKEYVLTHGSGHGMITDAGGVIELGEGLTFSANVRLVRAGDSLQVRLVEQRGENEVVTASQTVVGYYSGSVNRLPEIVLANKTPAVTDLASRADRLPINGDPGVEVLSGSNGRTDHFDAEGGNYILEGGTGADVYLLGSNTGHDTIREVGAGNMIRLKEGLGAGDVQLARDANDLLVQLLAEGEVKASYRIADYYSVAERRISGVVDSDGIAVFDGFAAQADVAPIRGGKDMDELSGREGVVDYFDADAGGDDTLVGNAGADVYWLGIGTGNDIINGADGDVIRLEKGLSARLSRSEHDLHVLLLKDGELTGDSYKVVNYYSDKDISISHVEMDDEMKSKIFGESEFKKARIRGDTDADMLSGLDDRDDHFDAKGGDHTLAGGMGSDVYWLGRGTGHDRIIEVNSDDDRNEIRLEEGLDASNLRLTRGENSLLVALLDDKGVPTDSYRIETENLARIPSVKLFDGTLVFSPDDYDQTTIRGGSGADHLRSIVGHASEFDADVGGDDHLYGDSGSNVYWLGEDTGHDTIIETGVVDDDVIRLKKGLDADDVRLVRSGYSLQVQLLNADDKTTTDSYTIENYYTEEGRRISRIEFADDTPDMELPRLDDSAAEVRTLGFNTGNHTISSAAGDVIRLEEDIPASSVRITRSRYDLKVELIGEDGVSASYTFSDYYTNEAVWVMGVDPFKGPRIFDAWDLDQARISGPGEVTPIGRVIQGVDGRDDHIDVDTEGDAYLLGRTGSDVYWLGKGAGSDHIFDSGGAADRISVDEDFAIGDIDIIERYGNLVVQIRGSGDLLSAIGHFNDEDRRIEHIDAGGGTLDTSRAREYMSALGALSVEDRAEDSEAMQRVIDDFWF